MGQIFSIKRVWDFYDVTLFFFSANAEILDIKVLTETLVQRSVEI